MQALPDPITAYILAKDGNRPHLLDAAFTSDATLRMEVRTASIAFPPASTGRDAIAETLVRRFNQTYENVYTFCLGEPPASGVAAFRCGWLVAMSEKQGGSVRVGCGSYDWSFAVGGARASALTITIDAMETLPADALAPVMLWVSRLRYPWCDRSALRDAAPTIPGVQHVLAMLR